MNDGKQARNAWLKSKRSRLVLKAAGVPAGAATAILAILAAPLTFVSLTAAGLGFATGTVIPGAEWLIDWREGRETWKQKGLDINP